MGDKRQGGVAAHRLVEAGVAQALVPGAGSARWAFGISQLRDCYNATWVLR